MDPLGEVEKLAGVSTARSRSYHGFNRTFAATHKNIVAASGQAGKRRETMEAIYEGARPDEKPELAMYLDSKVKTA